jgi:transcriptional regulator with XRE-family HTH domain
MDTSRHYEVRRGGDFGAAIAEARRERGLTQAELAGQLDIGRAYLAAIESGRANRLIEHLLRALRRLGAEVIVTWPAGGPSIDHRPSHR